MERIVEVKITGNSPEAIKMGLEQLRASLPIVTSLVTNNEGQVMLFDVSRTKAFQ